MRRVEVASFSESYKVNSQDSKAVTSTINCADLNWFIIQSTFFSFYISVLADAGYQDVFISCCLKSPTIFLELVFLSQLLSIALCYVEELLGLLKFLTSPGQAQQDEANFYIWNYLNLQDFFFPPVLKYVEAVHLLSCYCENLPRTQSYFSKCFLCLFCLTVRTLQVLRLTPLFLLQISAAIIFGKTVYLNT